MGPAFTRYATDYAQFVAFRNGGSGRHDGRVLDDDLYVRVIRMRVSAARRVRGMTQEEASDAAGMTLRSYQQLESYAPTHSLNPTFRSLRAVARSVGLTLSELVEEPTPEEAEAATRASPRPRRAGRNVP